jgi:hypothetical protein
MTNPEKIKGHAIHTMSWKFMYDHKDIIYDLGKKLVEEYTWDASEIYNIQRHFIYDQKVVYPEVIRDYWINVNDWTLEKTNYKIFNKIDPLKPFDFYSVRRTGALKNKIVAQ